MNILKVIKNECKKNLPCSSKCQFYTEEDLCLLDFSPNGWNLRKISPKIRKISKSKRMPPQCSGCGGESEIHLCQNCAFPEQCEKQEKRLLMNKREALRNRRAELVCRELRHQIGNVYPAKMDLNIAFDLLLKWMSVAKKNKYIRPETKVKRDY